MRVVGGAGKGAEVEESAGSGAQPRWGPGPTPRRGAREAEPPNCQETNLKCFMNKLCHEMRQLDEQFVHLLVSLPGFRRQQYVVDDSVRLCVQLLYDWILHSRFQRNNYRKYYFTISKLFKHWKSWSCILYAMVHRSVLQWTKWEGTVVAVHFSNEERRRERTFVAVLHFHFMTLHSTDAKVNFSGKSTRFRSNVEPIETARLFPLPNTYRSSLAHATGDG